MAGIHCSRPHPATCDKLATRDANHTPYPSDSCDVPVVQPPSVELSALGAAQLAAEVARSRWLPGTVMTRGSARSSPVVIPITRLSRLEITGCPAASKKRRQTSPTAPARRSSSLSSCAMALPLCRSRTDGSRLPMPTRSVRVVATCRQPSWLGGRSLRLPGGVLPGIGGARGGRRRGPWASWPGWPGCPRRPAPRRWRGTGGFGELGGQAVDRPQVVPLADHGQPQSQGQCLAQVGRTARRSGLAAWRDRNPAGPARNCLPRSASSSTGTMAWCACGS